MADGNVKVERSAEFAAPADAVWERIGRFGDMSWHPAIHATENPGGSAVGAVRVLTLGQSGGPTITEELAAHSDQQRRYAYRIIQVDPAVLPVVNYASEIAVEATEAGSRVVWKGRFDAADGATESAASAAITGVYAGGLDALGTAFDG